MATLDEVVEIVVVSMRDAFLAVTVFVAAMVFLFSWLQYATSGISSNTYVARRNYNQLLVH